jgi:SAM-dependent MidA family methyltransferase
MSQLTTSAESEIRRRIIDRGPIPFAEFMDLALYWPGGGYYSASRGGTGGPFGSDGDYYTSPMAHPAFGALLAVQLYQFWLLLNRPNPFWVVEPGSGNGQLSRDILLAAPSLPAGFSYSLRYLCLDRSHQGMLSYPARTSPIVAAGMPLRNLQGCVISNELLDSFPVHQVRVEDGCLREVYVALESDRDSGEARLVERLGHPSAPSLAARLEEVGIRLTEGQTAEINLGLDSWADSIAGALESGFVLTIDYGRRAEELYSAELRPGGALVTYCRHTQTDAPLRHVGSQDITAQVDFTSVVSAGRKAGLEPLGCTTQARFLQNLGCNQLRRRVASAPLPVDQAAANRAGLLALIRADGLGDFKVLAQGKGLPSGAAGMPELWGFTPGSEAPSLAQTLAPPRLSPRHISLPQGWPRPAVQEFVLDDLMAGPFGGS